MSIKRLWIHNIHEVYVGLSCNKKIKKRKEIERGMEKFTKIKVSKSSKALNDQEL